jgi:hypothetical protein
MTSVLRIPGDLSGSYNKRCTCFVLGEACQLVIDLFSSQPLDSGVKKLLLGLEQSERKGKRSFGLQVANHSSCFVNKDALVMPRLNNVVENKRNLLVNGVTSQ